MAKSLWLLGRNIKNKSIERKLSIEDLATIIGESERDVRRVFTGRLLLRPQQLIKLADVFGCEVNDLFNEPETYIPFGECFGGLISEKGESTILNIIDDYIDLIESVNYED